MDHPLGLKVRFGDLTRGDQFIGDPHGGWKFVKTTEPGKAVRIADGEIIQWNDDAMVFCLRKGC